VAHLANKLSMPQEERDRARNMLEHGRSLEEASELTRLPMYLVRTIATTDTGGSNYQTKQEIGGSNYQTKQEIGPGD
jgi:hypothetical protein